MIAPARLAAYRTLTRIGRDHEDLATALNAERDRLADARDRALASDIVTGTLRWQGAIDALIAHAADRPLDRLDADVLAILRLSVYQLRYLTRVPASAAVDDGVSLVRTARLRSATGFVNAVLRRVSRQRDAAVLPARPSAAASRDAQLAYLTTTLSHPRWLAERWLDRLGFARAEAWMQFNNTQGPLTLRLSAAGRRDDAAATALAAAHVRWHPASWAPHGIVIDDGSGEALITAGLATIQDESSQLVPLLAGAVPDGPLLDLCAAPGGKTVALADAAGPDALIVACDTRSRRMRLLARTLAAASVRRARLVQVDATRPLPFTAAFRTVLVDAPCSGLGTVRRDPDIKWRRTEADLPRFAARQQQMLAHAARAVAPGGRLVYATCSTEPEENEQVVARFLATHSEFRRLPAGDIPGLPAAVVDADGALRTAPDLHHLEGFYGAAMVRQQM